MKFLKIKKLFLAFMSILCFSNVLNTQNALPEYYVETSFEDIDEDLKDYIEPLYDLEDIF